MNATKPATPALDEAVMMEWIGVLCSQHGLSAVVGRIWGLLLLAPGPTSLDALVAGTGAAKSTVSVGVRRLETLGLAQRVWVRGDRRDHYEVVADPAVLLRVWRQGWVAGARRAVELGTNTPDPAVRGRLARLSAALTTLEHAIAAVEAG